MSAAGENPLQALIKAQLLKNAYFTTPNTMSIVTIDDGDILDLIDKTLSPLNGGVAVSIEIPDGKHLAPTSSAVNLNQVVEIAATELWLINRAATGSGKSAYAVIRKIMATWQPDNSGGLHFWPPGNPFTRLEFQDYGAGRGKFPSGKSAVVYRASFAVKEIII
jgi:hypothetical protein